MVKRQLALALLVFSTCVCADIKDPTRPVNVSIAEFVSSTESEPVGFIVSTILKRKKTAWAIINGQKVSENQSIDGASVLKIEANRVLLDVSGEPRWLPLAQQQSLKKRLGE